MTRCRRCWAPQEQAWVEVTRAEDANPSYLPGRWERCGNCGSAGQPIEVYPSPPLGVMQGPSVPTPEQLLEYAGVWQP